MTVRLIEKLVERLLHLAFMAASYQPRSPPPFPLDLFREFIHVTVRKHAEQAAAAAAARHDVAHAVAEGHEAIEMPAMHGGDVGRRVAADEDGRIAGNGAPPAEPLAAGAGPVVVVPLAIDGENRVARIV